ncbi:hypothetical protein OIU79_027926 [Salix purpurea]|uniref:Uncharacterized protein n=1 Tax=Salix purpurea TaxID=77065 RepID=A0A9Q0VUR8_SALPP|nr:hypothetical protein OIU79_027926 [Salix purpurea]
MILLFSKGPHGFAFDTWTCFLINALDSTIDFYHHRRLSNA